ncbi:serine/threonine-protein kinase [Nocardioides luteus]|uniref:non-specific serine/threonine protein kinase n=1 Tax=Nocardioides luteus TaxID=1844 RepID=A0ABQ5ST68_9ACTN|nr:Stk1 family PASTA domain-containing Ser/Thr kinase [Nocardioides luteus]MDR7309972.1 serine/threonine-protein kinase [Nocardioides luteus]GGR59250.1 serine/threonine protein kinase [Nocardioides luteus]GLJ67119.1 serine/threonine protein kinase [Nocardioides luteus]
MASEADPRDSVIGRHGGGSATASDPLLGKVLGARYRIIEKVAKGGMATVYVAHDTRLDRIVAVKVMHQNLDEEGNFAERFVREGRSAAKLSHPNVVAVYDQDEDEGIAFLAMEYIEGHTLRDTIASQAPLGAAKALAYIEPILSAMSAAHDVGIVHRDIKPENVLITTGAASISQRVKVADFGLARVMTNNSHDATTGNLVGTVSYLAPELVTESKSGPRSDVYAVGVVLYELLTGRKPHSGPSPVDIAYKHVHEDVPPPSKAAPGIPRYVDALVARATARDPELRPADAGVLLRMVNRVMATLSAGIFDDPDLAADLALPTAGTPDVTAKDADSPMRAHGESSSESTAVLPPLPAGASGPAAPPPGRPPGPTGPPPGVGLPAGARLSLSQPEENVRIAPTPDQPKQRRAVPTSWKAPIAVGAAVLAVALVASGLWWFVDGRYERVPSVAGLTKAAATTQLQDAGFEVTSNTEFSDTVKKGVVIDSDPGRGRKALPGSTVEISVSKGVEEYSVPKLKGMLADDAQDELREIGLSVGEPIEKFNDKVEEGHVINTQPRPGTLVRPGKAVTLVISKGPAPVDIVDWTGRSAKRAKNSLEGDGLKVEIQEEESQTARPGTVLSQSPNSGKLPKGETVTLVVAKGPAAVAVPNVVGSSKDAARQTLEAAGFKVREEREPLSLGLDYVTRQEPAEGEAPYGSEITIWLN